MPFARFSLYFATLVGVIFVGSVVLAQPDDGMTKVYELEGNKQDLFQEISENLRCPTCTGLSVLDSDAPFSRQIKDIVQEQVEAGKSEAEVLAYFEQRYGPWILRSPPKRGFNLLAWAVPIAMLVLGPLLVWVLVWRRKQVVDNMGVRNAEAIISEFEARLAQMRSEKGSA